MQQIEIPNRQVHHQMFQDELSAALPHLDGLGVQVYGDERPIIVHVPDHVTAEDRETILKIGEAHDPSQVPTKYLMGDLDAEAKISLMFSTMLDHVNELRQYMGWPALSAGDFDRAVIQKFVGKQENSRVE